MPIETTTAATGRGSCSPLSMGPVLPRPLTSGRHRDTAPRWSPDGASLAFLSDREGDCSQQFLLPLSGGEPRQLTSLKYGAGASVWSPSGDRLAFAARVNVEARGGLFGGVMVPALWKAWPFFVEP